MLTMQANRLRNNPTRTIRGQVARAIGSTLEWGKALRVQKVDGQEYTLDTCAEKYFLLGFLLSYAQQSLRIADEWRQFGRRNWIEPVKAACRYLEASLKVLDQYFLVRPLTGRCVPIRNLNLYESISEILDLYKRVDFDRGILGAMIGINHRRVWRPLQGRLKEACGIYGQVDNRRSDPGWCILRRPILNAPPNCFEFHLADTTNPSRRMATIRGGDCFLTSYAFRQEWQIDPSLGGPYTDQWQAKLAFNDLSRFGGDFYGCFPDGIDGRNGRGGILPEVKIRIYNIDDVGEAYVNGTLVKSIKYGKDSDWVDVTNYLKKGENEIRFVVINGKLGGWTYGFIVKVNGEIIFHDECGEVGQRGCRNDDQTQGKVYDRRFRFSI